MKFFTSIIRVYLFKVILFVTLISSILVAWFFWKTQNQHLATLLAGISTGLFVAFLQLLISWNEHHEIETIKKLGIRQIKPYREGKEYYQKLIDDTKHEILVAGVTMQRFMEDFGDETRPDGRALIDALNRNVQVRVLIPKIIYLESKNKMKAEMSQPQLKQFTQKWPNFQCRIFDHAPAHSVVVADEECLVGPVFNHVESKSSPAIHLNISSTYAREYLSYFNHEWTNAQPI